MEPATEEGPAESGRGLCPPGGSPPPPTHRPFTLLFPYLGFLLIYSSPHLFSSPPPLYLFACWRITSGNKIEKHLFRKSPIPAPAFPCESTQCSLAWPSPWPHGCDLCLRKRDHQAPPGHALSPLASPGPPAPIYAHPSLPILSWPRDNRTKCLPSWANHSHCRAPSASFGLPDSPQLDSQLHTRPPPFPPGRSQSDLSKEQKCPSASAGISH